MVDFLISHWANILIFVLIFIVWADWTNKLDKIEKNTRKSN